MKLIFAVPISTVFLHGFKSCSCVAYHDTSFHSGDKFKDQRAPSDIILFILKSKVEQAVLCPFYKQRKQEDREIKGLV